MFGSRRKMPMKNKRQLVNLEQLRTVSDSVDNLVNFPTWVKRYM